MALLALLIVLNLSKQQMRLNTTGSSISSKSEIFVEISGDVNEAGVYIFESFSSLGKLLNISSLSPFKCETRLSSSVSRIKSGDKIIVSEKDRCCSISRSGMSAFYKTTLGIPLSLNEETEEGLTAIPGIGPKTAFLIVQERAARGGFSDTREIMSVPGIGINLYQKILPLLKL